MQGRVAALGASDEPWTHESIKPPATPPRESLEETAPTPTPSRRRRRAFQERAATATAALQRMLDASPQSPPSPLMNCTAATRLHARAAAGVGAESPTAAKKRLAELLRDSSSDSEDEAPTGRRKPIRTRQIMESHRGPHRGPAAAFCDGGGRGEGATKPSAQVVDALRPAKTARAPSPPAFDEEGDDESDGDAPAPAAGAGAAPAQARAKAAASHRRRRRGPERARAPADARDQEGEGR